MNKIAAFFLKILLHLYLKTLRVQVSGQETVSQTLKQGPVIFMIWHDSLLLTPLLMWTTTLRPLRLLISNSRDGDIPSLIAESYKNVSVVRVKHFARQSALIESCRLLRGGSSLLITPDGPRGPRRVMKEGILFASRKENVPIMPVTWEASKTFTLNSWDQFRIPLPFSRVDFHFGTPQIYTNDAVLSPC